MTANELIASFRYKGVTIVLEYRRSSAITDHPVMYYELTVWENNEVIDSKESSMKGFFDEVEARFGFKLTGHGQK